VAKRRLRANDPVAPLIDLQKEISEHCDGKLLACVCGHAVTPIVNRYADVVDVLAVVCLWCHAVNDVQGVDKTESEESIATH
jgi:hypothetical protein